MSITKTSSLPRLGTLRCMVLALALVLPTFAAAQQAGERALYVAYGCFQCHGYEGQGGAALRIAPTLYPFEAFAQLVRRPGNEMPAYDPSSLSDADLRAIYRYVQSIEAPPALDDISLLRP
jgi:mono/diheme cytochrome c family protein